MFIDVPSYPGYRVDTTGSVWTCWKSLCSSGRIITDEWHTIPLLLDDKGYPRVSLYNESGHKTWRVNRLILYCFTGENPPDMEAAHEDGNPINNQRLNLSWKTKKENAADKIKHGTDNRGEKHNMVKVTEEIVKEIRLKYRYGAIQRRLATFYGLSQCHVSDICTRKKWSHVQ